MTAESDIRALLDTLEKPYAALDALFVPLDRAEIKRTRNIQLIPGESRRRGGKYSYAEWAHVIGIFQSLICSHVTRSEGLEVLDVGCGSGLMAIACQPYVSGGGKYTGIDVSRRQVEFCRDHFPGDIFEFLHFEAANAFYSPTARACAMPQWPLSDNSRDLVTALSVWTHFNETDARHYMAELARVLKPGGKALVTFFLLDDDYASSLARRSSGPGRFHTTPQDRWIFDTQVSASGEWWAPGWVDVPEEAIGITTAGLQSLLKDSGLRQVDCYSGNWKEVPGLFFQDVLVLQKVTATPSADHRE